MKIINLGAGDSVASLARISANDLKQVGVEVSDDDKEATKAEKKEDE